MTYRIYNKQQCRYEDSFKFVAQDGRIGETVSLGGAAKSINYCSGRYFIVEPWTGFFDSNGKKIYCGDILELASLYDFKSKVIWESGGFWMVPIDPEGTTDAMRHAGHIRLWTITGNIHNAEFLEN